MPLRSAFALALFLLVACPTSAEVATRTASAQASQPVSEARLAYLLDQNQEKTRQQILLLRPSAWDKSLPAIAAIFGSLTASLVAFLLQRSRLKFDRRSAFQSAGIEAISEIKSFRSRQLNEFYAPLEALLNQGLVLRDEFYQRLQASNPPNVTLAMQPSPQAASGQSLHIQHAGNPIVPFRLIDEMWFIQKHCPDLVSNVKEIVRINNLIVKLLHDKIGMVLHKNTELSNYLGKFLAHQSVLEQVVRASSIAGSTSKVPKYSTAYPRGLDALVAADCIQLRTELAAWETQVKDWASEIRGA